MDNIKISMNITLPGGVMIPKSVAKKNLKDNYNHESVKISYKEGKKTKSEIINIHTRKSIPATLVVNMPIEAYKDMVDKTICPEFSTPFVWKKLNNTQRLELHLNRISEYHNGISYTYVVFED